MRRAVRGLARAPLVASLSAATPTAAARAAPRPLQSPFLASDATTFYLPESAAWFGIVSARRDPPPEAERPALAPPALCYSSDLDVVAKMLDLGAEVRFFRLTPEQFAQGPRAMRRAEPYGRVRLGHTTCGDAP